MKLNDKDWIKQTIGHKQTSAVPYNFMLSPPAMNSLIEHYGRSDLEEQLSLPIRMNAPVSVKPLFASCEEFGATVTDEFGVTWTTSDLDRGSPIGPALVEPDLLGYEMPNPQASYRFEGLGR